MRTPTPTLAAIATGSSNAGTAFQSAKGVTATSGQHRGGEAVVEPRALRDAVPEHDVEREQRAPAKAARPSTPPSRCTPVSVDAGDGEEERGGVAGRAGAESGERDHGEELDGGDRGQQVPIAR